MHENFNWNATKRRGINNEKGSTLIVWFGGWLKLDVNYAYIIFIMVNPFPFRSPHFKYSTWLGNTWLNEAIHTDLNFIVKSYDNMVHDLWLSLALQFGEENNLNVNYIMHFPLMYMLLKNLSLHLSQSNDFNYDCGFIWVAFRGPFLSILTPIFLWSLPLMPHNLHYHRPSMQPPSMLINWGAPKVFGNMNVIIFGNKTFVQMLGVIIGGT
jgi:hypothetical protein